MTAETSSGSGEAPLSEFGEFSLKGLTAGVSEMSIALGGEWIRLRIPAQDS